MMLRACLRRPLLIASLLAGSNQLAAANLIEIYDIAVERDSVIQATIAQYEAARQALPLARSALLPNVGLSADKAYTRDYDTSERYESDSITATLTQNIYAPAATAAVRSARLNIAQAAETLLEARQNLMFRTAQAYFNILTADEAYRAASSSREAIARQTEQAERRFEVGLTAVTDVKEAQAQLDLAIANEVVAENQLALAKESLRVIIAQEVPPLAKLREDAKLNSPTPPGLAEWLKIAEENSPRLEIARLDYELARMDVKSERAGRKPQVSLIGGYTNSTTESDNFPDREQAQLKLQLNYSLYTGGQTSALIHQAKSRSQQASLNYETVRRAVEQDTRDAFLSVIADISQAKALQQALKSTEVAREATQAGFDAGTRTAVEVLVSLRDTFSAYADYAAARHQFVLRSLQLRQAAGILIEDHLEAVNRSLE